jgi:hypothetical protein
MPEVVIGYLMSFWSFLTSVWMGMGPLVGVAFGWWLKEISERKGKATEKQNERSAVATVVMQEIREQGRMVAMAASYFNWVSKGNAHVGVSHMAPKLPTEPVIFKALAAKLPSLGACAGGEIIKFYSALERAKVISSASPVVTNSVSTNDISRQNFDRACAAAWTYAAKHAATSLRTLQPLVAKDLDLSDLSQALSELDEIEQGGSPNIKVKSAADQTRVKTA